MSGLEARHLEKNKAGWRAESGEWIRTGSKVDRGLLDQDIPGSGAGCVLDIVVQPEFGDIVEIIWL